MTIAHPEKSACITGIGQSEVARPSSRSALQLTCDAALQAISDAGLCVADIDGITTYPGKSNEGGGIAPVSSTEAMFALGLEPRWIGSSNDGHAHMGAIIHAVMAVATGLARNVLVYRTVVQASARAASRSSTLLGGAQSARVSGNNAWTLPFNALSPVNMYALYAQAYFDKYKATSAQLGWVAVHGRRMAALNPQAIYRDPISIDDYLDSRYISSPLRLFDCDPHVDGATAIVISHRDIAKDLRNPPLHLEAMGMSIGGMGAGIHTGDFTSMPADKAGTMLWQRTDLKPADVDVAQIYDGFSILTLLWLEAMQFCGRGEAAAFVEGGDRIALDGILPMNTGGGQLSAGRLHGYGHLHEACVQLWGRGAARQVKRAKVAAVTNGGYGYGALLLRTD